MTLAAEGVQLLGKNGRLASANRQQLNMKLQSASSLHCAAPAAGCNLVCDFTQAAHLDPERLQIVQWRGEREAVSTQSIACSNHPRACAPAAAHHVASEMRGLPTDEGPMAASSALQLAWTVPTYERLADASPTEVAEAAQHLWQQVAEGADCLDRLKPRNEVGMVIFGWPGTRNYIEAAANDRHPAMQGGRSSESS
eukprot:433484-Amphidinium_carterae.1